MGDSEKRILQPDFERKKILHRNACPTMALYFRGKILSPVVLKKEFLRKPNHPYLSPTPSKVKLSAPYLDFLKARPQFLWLGVSRRSRSRLVASLKFIVSFSVVVFHHIVANPFTAERPG